MAIPGSYQGRSFPIADNWYFPFIYLQAAIYLRGDNVLAPYTINIVFTKLNWPEKFRALLNMVSCKNKISAKVKANGFISGRNDFVVNSTKQEPTLPAHLRSCDMAIISLKQGPSNFSRPLCQFLNEQILIQ
jgi:hypothetical protein